MLCVDIVYTVSSLSIVTLYLALLLFSCHVVNILTLCLSLILSTLSFVLSL